MFHPVGIKHFSGSINNRRPSRNNPTIKLRGVKNTASDSAEHRNIESLAQIRPGFVLKRALNEQPMTITARKNNYPIFTPGAAQLNLEIKAVENLLNKSRREMYIFPGRCRFSAASGGRIDRRIVIGTREREEEKKTQWHLRENTILLEKNIHTVRRLIILRGSGRGAGAVTTGSAHPH